MNYTIGEMSKITNLPSSTLRYYDALGLLTNIKRNEQNYRVYSEYDVLVLKWIDCLKETGMPLTEIKNT